MKLDFPSTVAKFRSSLILVLAFTLIASQANAVCISAFEVKIQVTLLDTKAGKAPKDYSEVVVWLVPVGVLPPASLPRDLPRYSLACWWSLSAARSSSAIAIPGFTVPFRFPKVCDSMLAHTDQAGKRR